MLMRVTRLMHLTRQDAYQPDLNSYGLAGAALADGAISIRGVGCRNCTFVAKESCLTVLYFRLWRSVLLAFR